MILRRVPTDLPLFGAAVFALGVLALGFAELFADLFIGRPSSTSAFGLFIILILAALSGAAGYLIGLVARLIWGLLRPAAKQEPTQTRALQVIVVSVVLLASLYGIWSVLLEEEESQPSLITDTGIMSLVAAADFDTPLRTSQVVFRSLGKADPDAIIWGGNETSVFLEDLRIELKDQLRGASAAVNLDGLDYVTSIHAAHFSAAQGDHPFLVLVISGRATGRRAHVLVLKSDYQIVHHQRIERFWPLASPALEIRLDANQREVPIIGPDVEKAVALRFR